MFNPFKKKNQEVAVPENNGAQALARGMVSVQDIIAPSAIEVDFSHIKIGNTYFRTLFVVGYPRFVGANWLSPLVNFDHTLEIALFHYPVEAKDVLDDLRRKVGEMEATINADNQRGRVVDPTVQVALDDALSLQEQLVKGAERFFQLGLYVTIPADSLEELETITKQVVSTLGSLLIIAKPATLQMEVGFQTTIPLGVDKLFITRNMDTTSLATTFPFTSSELTANQGIMYGINEHNGSLIIFDRFTLENANSVVFAKSGAGKSVAGHEPVLVQDDLGTRLIPIGQLVDQLIAKHGITYRDQELEGVQQPNLKVYAFNQHLKASWSPVTVAARKTAPDKLHQFTTASGRSITVTDDHCLVVLRGGQVVSVRSDEIKEGDVLPVPRLLSQPSTPISYLTTKSLLDQGNYRSYRFRGPRGYRIGSRLRQLQASLPERISLSTSFARLLGYISSEGWIGLSYTAISNTDQLVLDDIAHSLKQLGLSWFTINRHSRPCQINIPARVFTSLLHVIGAAGKSDAKRVPSFLFNSTNSIIAAYLQAYFEGDGGVEKHQLSATTKSTGLASDVVYLLLRFGIVGRMKITWKAAINTKGRKKAPYYRIIISGQDNIRRFADAIGFLSETKNRRLALIISKQPNTNTDVIPGIGNLITEVWRTLYHSPYTTSPTNLIPVKNGTFSPSPQVLQILLKQINQRIDYLETTTAARIAYLRQLPRKSVLIESGRIIPQLNILLWQYMGQSWRLAKNGAVTMGVGNALKATQVVFGETYQLDKIRQETIAAFAELGLSLEQYDPSLWNYLKYRPSDRGSYQRLIQAIDYLVQQFEQKKQQVNALLPTLTTLQNLAKNDLFWDPVTNITEQKTTDRYVYDLAVNDEVFLAGNGGLFVHNSYLVKLETLRSLMFGAEIIVIDPEEEYKTLSSAIGGEYISFSFNSGAKINPFDLSGVYEEGENELGLKILSLHALFRVVMGNLNPSEDAILDRALIATYRSKGITPDPATQRNEPPLMEDLYKTLLGMEDEVAKGLADRIEKFIKGSLRGIFDQQSNVDIKNPFTVFSIKDLENELRPIAMFMILDYVWTKIKKDLKKRILVVDEAWYMMQYPDSATFLYAIAKRARKYYLGVTTITQDVEDFLTSDYGKAIITNSSMQILLKQSPAAIDKISQVFYLSEGEKHLLLASDIGEGLFFAGPNHVAMRVVASPDEHRLITSKPEEILRMRQQPLEKIGS